MNKLLLSKNGYNKIQIYPLKNTFEIPEDAAERVLFSEKIFNNLQQSDSAIRHFYYCNRKRGILVAVYEFDNKIYLDYCIHTADRGYYSVVLYILPTDSLADALSIAKFWKQNLNEIGNDYAKQIEDSEEAYREFLAERETNNDSGNDTSKSN